jgi:hypothetical protein
MTRGFVIEFTLRSEGYTNTSFALSSEYRCAATATPKIFADRTLSSLEPSIFACENHQDAESPLAAPGKWFHQSDCQLCAGFAGVPEVLSRYPRDLTPHSEEIWRNFHFRPRRCRAPVDMGTPPRSSRTFSRIFTLLCHREARRVALFASPSSHHS